MPLAERVRCAIDDADAKKFDAALTHALIAIDTTSKRLYPELARQGAVRQRYVRCLRDYYWLVEPMIGVGLNLVDTRFENVRLLQNPAPDLAEIIYEVFRTKYLHGDDPAPGFTVTPTVGSSGSIWKIAEGELHLPDRLLWALLGIAVLSRANSNETSEGDAWLSLGEDRFPIRDWWGRESDFRAVADRYNTARVTLAGLGSWPKPGEDDDGTAIVVIAPPHPEQEPHEG